MNDVSSDEGVAYRQLFREAAALISEGFCPHCRGELQRREDFGACEPCALGWRLRRATEGDEWLVGELLIEQFVMIVPDMSRWPTRPEDRA